MYTLDDFGRMIADKPRMEAHIAAIVRAVRPGDVVVDIGCGVGMFALLACRAGARKVYAIESSEMVRWGKQFAAANGFTEKIEFLQGDSRHMKLPERANVIVSDIRGALPLFGNAIESIEDARKRFLAPGGIQIPQVDRLYAAIVETSKMYDEITAHWRQGLGGVDLSCVLPTVLSSTYHIRIAKDALLTEAKEWCRLEYAASPSKKAAANIQFKAIRPGTGHGIGLWFETQLFEEIRLSSGPTAGETIYARMFLPWPEPMILEAGEEVDVELHADPVAGTYIWRWETKFPKRAERPESAFRQSTFQSAKYTHEVLRRRASGFVPSLTELGEAQRWMLQAVDGKTSLEAIALAAVGRFPQVFHDIKHALRTAAELAEKFSS
jgi:protein arginine N-methyltransferase 1